MRDILPARHFPRFTPGLVALIAMLFTFALAACYESDPVKSLALSPDGSRAASVTAGGVLNILDLRTPGTPIVQYSNQVKGSVGWSPESRQLAFVEQFPRQPAGLWAIDPALQRPNAALLSDVSWKSDPGWLSDGRIVFRSDRGEDQVSVWALDPVAHRIEKLLAAETDITRLWAAPGGDSLVYQTTGPDGANLWLWRPGAKPFQMTSGQRHYSPADQMVSIPADGRGVAFVARGEREPRVFWFDARKMAVRDELVLERVPDGIAALTKGRVAVAMGTDLRIWRPGHPLLHRNLIVSRFEGLPLALPQRQSDGGVTLVVNQSILLSARNAGRLERGVMHVDGIEEMLLLARARVEAGNPDAARSLLDRLWKDTADSSKRYMIAVARGRLERSQQHWGAAQSWLTRAIEIVAPGSPEAQAAELERLCVGAFDQHSSSQLAAGLKDLDAAAASTELARWLAAGKGNSRLKIWLAVGGDVRAERDERAAAGLEMISRDDGWTSHSLAGLQLLLDGEFEPLLEATHQRQTDRMNKLLLEPSMQLALMRALESKNEGGPSHEELSQTILMQMVRRGDTAGARRFVQNDLSRPTPLNGYPAIFSQFVGLDETEPQTYRVVRDVLLAPDVADRLYGRLEDPRERLLMRMSQVKSALIDARAVPAQGWLRDCQSILNQLPVEENGDNLQELARQLFLLDLFEAKLNEQRGRWNEALVSYKRALELIGRIPNEWDALSYEIAASVGLIEMGRGDADLLASFVRLLRSVGDPVLSPIRQPAAIMTALENFDQFERSAGGEAWIRPWIAYGRGLCYSQLDWPAQALYHLTIARRLNPPPALMQRILLEESAVRDGIGQHAMAARLLEGIVRSRVAEPVRAGAMLAQLQAETASGAQIAPLDRAGKLIQKYGLEPRWRRWLWNQLGGDAI